MRKKYESKYARLYHHCRFRRRMCAMGVMNRSYPPMQPAKQERAFWYTLCSILYFSCSHVFTFHSHFIFATVDYNISASDAVEARRESNPTGDERVASPRKLKNLNCSLRHGRQRHLHSYVTTIFAFAIALLILQRIKNDAWEWCSE